MQIFVKKFLLKFTTDSKATKKRQKNSSILQNQKRLRTLSENSFEELCCSYKKNIKCKYAETLYKQFLENFKNMINKPITTKKHFIFRELFELLCRIQTHKLQRHTIFRD